MRLKEELLRSDELLMDVNPTSMGQDAGLVCLSMLARLHGKAADPEQLKHQLALTADAELDDLLLACKRLELKGKIERLNPDRVASGQLPMPCIVATDSGLKILAGINPTATPQVLLHDPVEGRPVGITLEAFLVSLRTSGDVHKALFVTSRSSLAAELARFDFTWFVPAIVKYRRLLGEALTASLFLQSSLS